MYFTNYTIAINFILQLTGQAYDLLYELSLDRFRLKAYQLENDIFRTSFLRFDQKSKFNKNTDEAPTKESSLKIQVI